MNGTKCLRGWVLGAALLAGWVGQGGAMEINTRPRDLAARLNYETRSLSDEGVYKLTRHQDRLIRVGDQVWLERVLPPGRAAPEHGGHDHAGHDHGEASEARGQGKVDGTQHRLDLHDVNFEKAARAVSRDEKGVHLAFVSAANRLHLQVEPENYQAVGFNGSWDAAYYLIDPTTLARLQPLAGRTAPAGAVWLGERRADHYLRVLWSQTLALPLRIESGHPDGSLTRTIVVQPERLPRAGQLPWQQLGDYLYKDYNDLLD